MQICKEGGQLSLFAPDTSSGKTCRARSAAGRLKGKISALSWKRSSALKAVPFLSLDLTPGHGNLLGESYWELISPWLGGSSMLNTGPAPLSEENVYSLSQILEDAPPRKYYLSKAACLGILRRAKERGKELPPQLNWALMVQAGLIPLHAQTHSAALAAGFSAGAGASAGGIGYSSRIAPTLKGSAGGNCMPSVLCLNDQGGQRIGCSEEVSGTLRAQEHGHQPLLFENHGIDARCTGPHPVSPTLSARTGTGGNNLPIVSEAPCYCITGNAIDRQPQNGGNGIGYQEDISYTLTATDHHAVFSRQRVDVFKNDDVASTESACQHKDATDLVLHAEGQTAAPAQNNTLPCYLIRRLTPLECERLQGFPDDWTALPQASDSARYKALGNSVAIPCVEYIMHGIALAAQAS